MKRLLILLLFCGLVRAGAPAAGRHPDHWFAKDKLLHFSFSMAAAAGLGAGYRYVADAGREESLALAGGWSVVIGLAKEDYDKNEKKTFFSFKDLAADLLGVGAGLYIVSRFR